MTTFLQVISGFLDGMSNGRGEGRLMKWSRKEGGSIMICINVRGEEVRGERNAPDKVVNNIVNCRCRFMLQQMFPC